MPAVWVALPRDAGSLSAVGGRPWPRSFTGPLALRASGALLTGDSISVKPNHHVSLMYAYPNLIPLSAAVVTRVVNSVELGAICPEVS